MTATLRKAAAPPSLAASSASVIAVPQEDGNRSTRSGTSRPTMSSDEAVLTNSSLCDCHTMPSQQRTVAVAGSAVLLFALILFFSGDVLSTVSGRSTRSSGSDAALKVVFSLTPIQTQVVHRHGDRTPITPMADESYWQTLLPSDETIDYISQKTKIIRLHNAKAHPAGGGNTFGRLTQDGIRQMHQLGVKLRSDVERLMRYEDDGVGMKGLDHVDVSEWLRVSSTDFSRTLQSVQAVLVGLLQDSNEKEGNKGLLRGIVGDGITSKSPVPMARTKQSDIIEIDARHTSKMIPDPQPRRYVGQVELERQLLSSEMFANREATMKPLAIRVTRALFDSGLLGDAASKVSFGVGEDETASGHDNRKKSESPMDLGSVDSQISSGTKPLPWNQLAEILKCLERRNKLPVNIKAEDLEAVADHNAWRWFALLGDSRLAPMAIKSLAKKMILNGIEAIDSWKKSEVGDGEKNNGDVPLVQHSSFQSPPLLHIFSGHDATLIALMCAFHIERPSVWPEYGSYLKMELLRDDAGLCGSSGFDGCRVNGGNDVRSKAHYYILFSLNGEALRSSFGSRDKSGRGQSRYFVPWEDALEGLKYQLEKDLPDLA